MYNIIKHRYLITLFTNITTANSMFGAFIITLFNDIIYYHNNSIINNIIIALLIKLGKPVV